ncbi:MAG TPA: polyphosphate kinase 2 family protein [Bryobacteraceae bacterium]|jgi:PPK2 family polyphosphate:nucleotide phosphotransferase
MKNDLRERFRVRPGKKFHLDDRDPDDTAHITDKETALSTQQKNTAKLADLHDLLYAEQKHALLIVLQGMDAAGKDGTIKHVMSGVNPAGCTVTSFKVPTAEEAAHDFLWRIHKAVPPKGYIGIFNRSQYEDVLVTRVHKMVTKEVWESRYDRINDFEELLAENHVIVLKFFLHISKEEQKCRFDERRKDADKNWKISDADARERAFWGDYQKAYEDAIEYCSTKAAPWYVVPSNKKWFRNLAVSQMIVESLEELKMSYPRKAPEPKGKKP